VYHDNEEEWLNSQTSDPYEDVSAPNVEASAPKLTVVGPTDSDDTFPPTPTDWTGLSRARSRWLRIMHISAQGVPVTAPQAARAYELLACLYWPVSYAGTVYALPRRTTKRPDGGILVPLDTAFSARVSAQFSKLDTKNTLTISAYKDAAHRWRGEARVLTERPYTRWGRGSDGAMWWDSGDADGHVVRVDATGWSIEAEPACWFVRPSTLVSLPLPTSGGSIDELWNHVNIPESDRHLVLAWLLASTLAGQHDAAGMLFITGPAGVGKSTSMSVLTAAAGGEANRQAQSGARESDQDLFAVAQDGWVLGVDNVSAWSAKESDHLCTLITGVTKKLRTLYTTADVTYVHVRRPVIATSIEVPVLREDLVRRMVHVRLSPLSAARPEDALATSWEAAQPKVFGAVLDLLVNVLALGDPPADANLTTLASWGRMAWGLDQILPPPGGVATIELCVHRRTELAGDGVVDDPFWIAAEAVLEGRDFVGTMAAFVRHVTPVGVGVRLPKTWPTARGMSSRVERRRAGLETAGWSIVKLAPGNSEAHRAPKWRITPPPADGSRRGHGDGCQCTECTEEF